MSVTIRVDAGQLGRRFERLPGRLDESGPRRMLEAVAAWMESVARRSFDLERSPEGRPWAPLSVSYRGRKGGGRILQRTGALRRAVRAGVEGNVAFVSVDVPYAAAHQFGHRFPAATVRPKRVKALRFFAAGLNADLCAACTGGRAAVARPPVPAVSRDRRAGVGPHHRRADRRRAARRISQDGMAQTLGSAMRGIGDS